MRKSILHFILIFTVLTVTTYAQNDAPLRLEFQSSKEQDEYNVALTDTAGLFVFYDGGQISEDSIRWIFIQYDTNLLKLRHFYITFPIHTDFITQCTTGELTYLLFQKWISKREPATNYLVTLNTQTNQYKVNTIAGLTNDNIKYMYAAGEQLAMVSEGNDRDSIFYYNTLTDKVTTISDIFPFRTEFCIPDTANHRWITALKKALSDNSSEIQLVCFDWEQREVQLIPFPSVRSDDAPLIYKTARAFALNADSTLIIGTYNLHKDRNSVHAHSGVYTMLLKNNILDTVRIFNFTSLKSFAAAYPNNNLNLQLLIGATAHDSAQFTLISEVYYPEYSYDNYNTSYFDSPYSHYAHTPTTTFSGYHFVNAYVTTFNKDGELLWDNYFSLDNIILSQLYSNLSLTFINEDALLYYTRHNRIISTLINGYETVAQISSVNIETSNPRESVESCKDIYITPWYKNNFIVTGYHNLKNRDKAVNAKRSVFFINKLEYR